MFAIEILHKFTPDEERRQAAKVWDNCAEHLTYAERCDVEKLMEALEAEGNRAMVLGMQHVGPIGDALDLACTVASAGEALCQFALSRALLNPHELAAAKCGIAECWLAVSDTLTKLDFSTVSNERHDANTDAAIAFLNWAPDRFVPLFEDLEAHARKKFPHLAANDEAQKEGATNV
jgi:hypothetical protein